VSCGEKKEHFTKKKTSKKGVRSNVTVNRKPGRKRAKSFEWKRRGGLDPLRRISPGGSDWWNAYFSGEEREVAEHQIEITGIIGR